MRKHLTEYCYEINEVHGGFQKLYSFDNKYGASVIKHEHSYGFAEGKWEVAVLDSQGKICYTTEITDDVIGYLTWSEVSEVLRKIEAL